MTKPNRGHSDGARSIYLPPWRVDVVRRPEALNVLADRAIARAVAGALLAADAPQPGSVTVVLTDDAELAELNAEHLRIDGPTDVLSFPMLPPEAYPGRPGAERAISDASTSRAVSRASTSRAVSRASASRAAEPSPLPPVIGSGRRVHLGDIAISVERAIEQAEAGRGGQTGDVRWSASDELRLLVTHGTLHLCGWDHAEPTEEAAMRALERELLAGERR